MSAKNAAAVNIVPEWTDSESRVDYQKRPNSVLYVNIFYVYVSRVDKCLQEGLTSLLVWPHKFQNKFITTQNIDVLLIVRRSDSIL